MDRHQVMNKLFERNFMDQVHRNVKEGLIGSLRNEYLLQKPMREPYEQYVQETNTMLSLPIFHAIVDMMTASILNLVSGVLINEVLSAIEDIEAIPNEKQKP